MRIVAVDYPLLNIFWTTLWFAILVGWIMALFTVIADVFRSRDMGGVAKGFWILFIIVLPLLGVLVYLIARGGKMADHAATDAVASDQAMRAYIQDATSSGSTADELAKLADLRDRGAITDAEYEQGKARVLGG
jgi:Short C-terminal domain/Phospholipase_D-nuclease N-terminal